MNFTDIITHIIMHFDFFIQHWVMEIQIDSIDWFFFPTFYFILEYG